MKLMVVDDNRQIREGIRYGIQWEEYGIEEVRDYGDGAEALAAMEEYGPDIILADIRMPNLDGLSLLERVRDRARRCKFILLSAYSEFSYAQKALRLGADDYILKPIKPGKLVETVMRQAETLLDERQEKEAYYEVYERSFLHSLMSGGEPEDANRLKQLLEQKYGIFLTDDHLFLTLLEIERADGKPWQKPVDPAVFADIRRQLSQAGAVFPLQEGRLLLAARGERSQLMSLNRQQQVKTLIEGVNRELGDKNLAVTAGISDSRGIRELYTAFEHAREALELTFYERSGACALYMEGKRGGKARFPEELQRELREAIALALKKGDKKELHRCLEALRDLGNRERYDRGEMTGFLKKLYLYLIRRAGLDSDPEFERIGIEGAFHFESCIAGLEEYLNRSAAGPGPVEGYSSLIRNVCAYVEEHYDEPISVELVGGLFGRTPNYLSAKFKKEVGKSFTDYLIELRVQKAVGLLKYTNTPVSQVAVKVGFGSYAYFSRIFHRYTGKNASAFRNGEEDG